MIWRAASASALPYRLCRMRIQTFWVLGWSGILLGIALHPGLGHTACLATAEMSPPTPQGAHRIVQGPALQGSRAAESRPRSADSTRPGTIHLNFRNVDIVQMITMMSTLTGRNFLVDDKVRGKVTLMAPTPVTIAEAYQLFLSALAMQGFTVVPQGPISTIVPSRDAKTHALPTRTPPAPSSQ